MRGVVLAAVLIALGAGVVWFAVSSGPEAVRTTTTPPPPTRAELLNQKIDAIEQQLVAGEKWREQVYADKKRSSGYERPMAAYQRSYTPDVRAMLQELREGATPSRSLELAADLREKANHLHVLMVDGRMIAQARGQTVSRDVPPRALARLLLGLAEFLDPATSPAPK